MQAIADAQGGLTVHKHVWSIPNATVPKTAQRPTEGMDSSFSISCGVLQSTVSPSSIALFKSNVSAPRGQAASSHRAVIQFNLQALA